MASDAEDAKLVLNISLRLPGCSEPVQCRARPDDTLDNLLRTALAGRPWFPIADVRTRPRSLITGPTWRQRTIASCRLRENDELRVTPAAPQQVCVGVYAPGSSQPVAMSSIQLAPQDWNWASVRDAVVENFGQLPATFIAFQQGLICGGNSRRGVFVLDPRENKYLFVDDNDGEEVDPSLISAFTADFMEPQGGLRFTANLVPFVYIYIDLDLLRVTKITGHHINFRLVPVEQDALFHQRFILQLHGLRLQDALTASWECYVVLSDGSYCSCRTGAVFENEDAVVGAGGDKMRAWRRFRLLLADGDPLPRYRLPQRKSLFLWKRPGLKLKVVDGQIQILETGEESGGTWVSDKDVGDLERIVTDGVRIKK